MASRRLKRLSNVSGLNRLSSNSVINFSGNLTVIYGENGTGKSGFTNALNAVGLSFAAKPTNPTKQCPGTRSG